MHRTTLIALGLAIVTATVAARAEPNEIKLPPDVSKLRASRMPGYTLAQQKCGICHSADYINFQPPGMNLKQWIGEMAKMQHSYGAPISDNEVKALGAYLAVAYGTAKRSDSAVMAVAALDPPVPASSIDVQALLGANACLGCHAIDKKIVGPAFNEVAGKYKGDATAQLKLAASIKQGGVGKWGPVAMPPMAGLNDAQAKAVAAFVLKQ